MKKEQALKIIKQALEVAIGSGKIIRLEDMTVIIQAFDFIKNESLKQE
jgi:hypothetical protein